MPLYYVRFKHNTRNDAGDLVAHLDCWENYKDPDDFEEFEEKVVKVRFTKLFDGDFGEYGRRYVLRDFGVVTVGSGYMAETHDSKYPE